MSVPNPIIPSEPIRNAVKKPLIDGMSTEEFNRDRSDENPNIGTRKISNKRLADERSRAAQGYRNMFGPSDLVALIDELIEHRATRAPEPQPEVAVEPDGQNSSEPVKAILAVVEHLRRHTVEPYWIDSRDSSRLVGPLLRAAVALDKLERATLTTTPVVEEAVKAEREACAAIIDANMLCGDDRKGEEVLLPRGRSGNKVGLAYAAAIRARSATP